MDNVRPFDGGASWIWAEGGVSDPPAGNNDSPFRTIYLRRRFSVEAPEILECAVSADAQYVLSLNGEVIGRGPAKGDPAHYPYDEYTVESLLEPGENVLAAVVVSYAPSWPNDPVGGPISRMSPANGFIFDGICQTNIGDSERIVSDSQWKVLVDSAYSHPPHDIGPAGSIGRLETLDGTQYPRGWTKPGFDDSSWNRSTAIETGQRRDDPETWRNLPYRLVPRSIPHQRESMFDFETVLARKGITQEALSHWYQHEGTLEVPANAHVQFILDAGVEETAFPVLSLNDGEGGAIELTYAEGWTVDGSVSLRDDPTNGSIGGYSDRYLSTSGNQTYEPFHWRTFRYVKVDIETADQPLTLDSFRYRRIGYPFEELATCTHSEASLAGLWDVSWRTVERCSHATFEDCPYYEQLQYGGDVHPVSLIAGYVSGDWQLTRQFLRQFDYSRNENGLTESRYPSRVPQHIPSWSLHWIYTARDYWWHTGDENTIEAILPGIDHCLSWFDRQTHEDGLLRDLPYWQFIDWVPAWESGQPPVEDGAVPTAINAQYRYALLQAGELHEQIGSTKKAARYRSQAEDITKPLRAATYDSDRGYFWDSSSTSLASEPSTAWAVLADVHPDESAGSLASLLSPRDDTLEPASLFGRFYVNRALEELDAYGSTPGLFDPWRTVIQETDLTTLPETRPSWNPRSFCHAWSAAPIYELLAGCGGIKPANPGFETVHVEPTPRGLTPLKVQVPIEAGMVSVEYDGNILTVEVPEGVPATIVHPHGGHAELEASETIFQG